MANCVSNCCFLCYRAHACICTRRALLIAVLIAAALSAVLVPAFGVVRPVRATVEGASLSRLALAGANGTALAYDLALTVALHNDNWAMRAEHYYYEPLKSELRFAGRRLDGGRLETGGRRIEPRRTEELRVVAVSSSEGVALSGDDAAEFAMQSVAGMSELELKLSGEFTYGPVYAGDSIRLEATCPVRLQMTAAPSRTYFMLIDKVIQCY